MYTTQALIESRLGSPLTSAQAAYFEGVLDGAVDQEIRRLTGTSFGNGVDGEEAITLYEDGEGTRHLILPVMREVTEVYWVANNGDETLIDTADYYTYPRGGSEVYALTRKNGCWCAGFENYKVVGKLGFADIPADIQRIATELAVIDLKANLNNEKMEVVGDYRVMFRDTPAVLSDSSLDVLNGYKRLSRSI